jgi:hypothetical protein
MAPQHAALHQPATSAAPHRLATPDDPSPSGGANPARAARHIPAINPKAREGGRLLVSRHRLIRPIGRSPPARIATRSARPQDPGPPAAPVPNPDPFQHKEFSIVSAMHGYQGGVHDDTADLGPPLHPYPGHDLDEEPDTTEPRPGRLRPTSRVRQVHGIAMAACYASTLGAFAWLLGEALLHMDALIMLVSVGLLAWLAPEVPRLWRWLRTGSSTGQAVPLSWLVQLVVTAITALNLVLLVYAHI